MNTTLKLNDNLIIDNINPMKNLYFTFLFLLVSFLSIEAQQSFNCNDDVSLNISAVQCENNNNDDPGDDYLTFVLTVTDYNGSSNYIYDLPVNSTSRDNEGNMRTVDFPGDLIPFSLLRSPYSFNVPSMDCADVPFNLTLNNGVCLQSGLLSAANLAPIPTLGQWAIIVLGLSLCVIGVVFVRKEMVSRQVA